MRQNAHWPPGRWGLTLIEVMASLALLGTTLTLLTMAHGRHRKQVRLAEKRIVALEAADQLLTEWDANWQTMRHGQSGVVPGETGFLWQVRAMPVPSAWQLGAQVVRLEIWDSAKTTTSPLALVDVLSTEISAVSEDNAVATPPTPKAP